MKQEMYVLQSDGIYRPKTVPSGTKMKRQETYDLLQSLKEIVGGYFHAIKNSLEDNDYTYYLYGEECEGWTVEIRKWTYKNKQETNDEKAIPVSVGTPHIWLWITNPQMRYVENLSEPGSFKKIANLIKEYKENDIKLQNNKLE